MKVRRLRAVVDDVQLLVRLWEILDKENKASRKEREYGSSAEAVM